MTEFIFMLTHHDVTIKNAIEVLEEVRDIGLRYIGCKDVGLTPDQYKELFYRMKQYGMETFLEVVTYNESDHFKGVELALEVNADNLIGGMPMYSEKTLGYLKKKGRKIGFYPYIGKISGQPCIQEGSIEETVASGRLTEALGVDGINLLLYRYMGDQKRLLEATIKELKKPLIVAGNVVNFEQIDELKKNNIWAFTIGGAIFEKKFITNGDCSEQIKAVLNRLRLDYL